MTLGVATLKAAKDDIATVLEAIKSKDTSATSAEASRIVAGLLEIDDADWNDILENLEDDELQEQADSLRKILLEKVAATTHVRQVGHFASFTLSPPDLTIRLTFKAGGQTLDTTQDLDDALWVGGAVVEAVTKTMQSMMDAFNLQTQRAHIGSNFKGNLELAEVAIAEVRRIYELIENADPAD